MAAPKGNKFSKGRGNTPNKVTREFKEAVTQFVNLNQERFGEWLEQIESPKDRFDVVIKLAEYAYPKYARIEHTGKDGGAIETLDITPEQRREALKRILNAKRG
jgi:hypothetical protein